MVLAVSAQEHLPALQSLDGLQTESQDKIQGYIPLCFERKPWWMEEAGDALVCPQSQGGDGLYGYPGMYGFVRDFVSSLGLSQMHYRNRESYRVKGEEQFMD